MSLPAAWVDRIFTKMALVYGRDFASRWEGLNLVDVKADWAHELDGYDKHPKAIAHALQNLPSRPPTVLEFRALARAAPSDAALALGAPRANAVRVAAELEKLVPLRVAAGCDSLGWARRIVARHAAGDRVPLHSLRMARSALGGVAA
jgi:hypothetical protein